MSVENLLVFKDLIGDGDYGGGRQHFDIQFSYSQGIYIFSRSSEFLMRFLGVYFIK
jgi:hypothetical protein